MMQHINRLLRTARKAARGTGLYIMCFVDSNENGKYTAKVKLCGRRTGSGNQNILESEYNAEQEAINACYSIEKKYPDNTEFLLFIMDYGPKESG